MTEGEKIMYATWLSRVGVLEGGAIRQSCIASCAVLTAVLRSTGILAKPVCVSVAAMTKGWREMLERGERPDVSDLDAWWEENRAWSAGVAYDPTPNENAYTGHVAVIANRSYFCDPSLDQLSRPERGMPLDPIAIPFGGAERLQTFLSGEEQIVADFTDDHGENPMTLVYSLFKDDVSFLAAPDWAYRNERWGDVVESVAGAIRSMEYKGMTGDSLPDLPPIPESFSDPSLYVKERGEDYRRRVKMVDR